MNVTVRRVPLPPVLGVTELYVPELKDVGTLVGNVMATDPSNFTVTSYAFTNAETPDAFAIGPDGNVTVKQRVDSLALLKSVWTYTVNATNAGGTWGLTTIHINVLVVPRPPVIFAQLLFANDDVAEGALLTPGLVATHPQGLNMTWRLSPPNGVFNVTPSSGFVFRRLGTPPIDYYAYEATDFRYTAQSIEVTDTAGQTASAALTVQLVETNKPPSFGAPTYNYTVDEGAAYGSLVASLTSGVRAPAATDPNRQDVISYRILAADPPIGTATFTADLSTCELGIGPAVSVTGNRLYYDRALAYPRPFTFKLALQAKDSRTPPMAGNATAWVKVTRIKPRVGPFTAPNVGGVYTLPGAPAAGLLVVDLGALTWAPVPASSLLWRMDADATFEGETAFMIEPDTGRVRVVNMTYCTTSGGSGSGSGGGGGLTNGTGSGACTVTGYGAPHWNYNTRSSFAANVTVTNIEDSTSTTVALTFLLAHINRPPRWLSPPSFYARASEAATVGSPLLGFVSDADVPLNIGENLTFALLAGNRDGTFALNALTGELAAVNATADAFRAPPTGPGFFNLTVSVTDAGLDGPAYTAVTWVYVNVTDNNVRPSFPAARYGFAVAELVPVGTLLGEAFATDFETTQRLNYSLVPRGKSVNLPFPFAAFTAPGGASPQPHNKAIIRTIADGPIDWNAVAQSYNATLIACDDRECGGSPCAC
jgi:hypothetical protein